VQGGNVNAAREISGDGRTDWEEACRREEQVRRLVAEERSGGIGRAAVGEAAAKLGISVASLYRLIQRFRKDRRVSTLLPRKAGRPAGARYISDGVEEIIHAAAREIYLVPERPPFRELVRQVAARCRNQGEQAPDARTIRSRLDDVDP
jgi:putative transposase